jgi:hypothetical protein
MRSARLLERTAPEFILETQCVSQAQAPGLWKLRQDSLRIMRDLLFGAMVQTRSTHLARRRIGPQTASVLRSVLRPLFFGASATSKAHRKKRDPQRPQR